MRTLAHIFLHCVVHPGWCLKLWLGIGFLVFTSLTARAAPVILQADTIGVINLAPMTAYYLDSTTEMTITNMVEKPSGFVPVKTQFIDFGIGSFRAWLKVSVINPEKAEQIWRLDMGFPYKQNLDVYVVSKNNPVKHVLHNTMSDDYGKRPINALTLMVDISLPPSEIVDIYIAYRSLSTSSLPITIGRPAAIVEARAKAEKTDALVNGALLAMILLSWLMLPFTGWRLSLAFACYIAAGMLYIAHADGYTFKYLWPNWPNGNDGLNLALALVMTTCGINFARILFNFAKTWPAYNRFMLGYIALTLLFVGLAVPFIRTDWLMMIGYALVPVGAIIQSITGLLVCRKGYLGAGPYITGASFVLLSLIYAAYAHFYPGDYDLDRTLDIGHIALLGECFAFTGTIVVRLLGLQRERDAAMSAELVAVKDKLAMSSTLRETQNQYTQARDLALRRKDQLSSVSHDLQQPLTSLRHTIADMEIDNDEASKQMLSALDYLEQLAKDQMKSILNEPRKIQSDGSVEIFPLSIVQNNVYEMFHVEAESKGLSFRLYALDDLIEMNAVSLMRVISNLVHNAIHHTTTGGVLLGARRRATHIIIEVYDTGYGMSKDDIERMMKRHEKGEKSIGSGLGLDIVQDISTRYALDFRLTSRAGRGTCARIIIPRHIKTDGV